MSLELIVVSEPICPSPSCQKAAKKSCAVASAANNQAKAAVDQISRKRQSRESLVMTTQNSLDFAKSSSSANKDHMFESIAPKNLISNPEVQ